MPFTIGGDWVPQEEPQASCAAGKPVKVRLEKRGRAVLTVVLNLSERHDAKALAKDIKRACGCGGTVKQGVIELQGERVEEVRGLLRARGIKAQ
jgi:translation initiation factor 1